MISLLTINVWGVSNKHCLLPFFILTLSLDNLVENTTQTHMKLSFQHAMFSGSVKLTIILVVAFLFSVSISQKLTVWNQISLQEHAHTIYCGFSRL